ncbi:hypothetical protein AVEN_3915-1 [Araneus ventricosus]|uniref:Tc1-like transposase DDE domain-containing protein n=1 Tax=Araneus ventricosus TaxID=182803 RepID=A0A4Y2IGI5_ARAVE|nr:hypothetical protein AVEN_3915-1 [Araneus ventricosus]
MEELAAETSTRSISARESGRITGIPESSTRRILHGSVSVQDTGTSPERCPVSGWKTYTVTVEWYITLLRDHVVPALQERHELPVVTFIQDGAPPHFAREVRTFLLEIFTDYGVMSRGCKFKWPSRSPDLTR